MIGNLSKPGTSFKGAFAYHAHDKGRTDTADRVEWVSTRNLMTDDVARAERIMIATALDADRLKQESGVHNTGRKSAAHVQTLSLSWSPDERVSREEMERAADEAISRLGLEDHQAVVLAHNDTAHQHVHVIVNRVNPQDGRMATLSNGKRKLDQWAHEYEKRRGRIVTPKRAEKYQRREAARQRYTPEQRRAYAERKRAEAAKQATEARNQRVALSARQKDMRERHSAQWEALEARHKAQVVSGQQDYKARVAEAMQRHDKGEGLPPDTWSASDSRTPSLRPDAPLSNAEFDRQRQERDAAARVENRKREWGEFYRQQRKAERQRADMEKSPVGRLALAITAAREEKAQGSKETLWRLTLVNLISREHREKVFAGVTERDKKALIERQNFSRNQIRDQLRREYAAEIEARRSQQQEERDSLKREQAAERGEIRDQWQQLNERGDRLKGLHDRTQQKENDMARDPGTHDPTKPPPQTFEPPSPERGIRNAMGDKERPQWRSDDYFEQKSDPQGAKRQNDALDREIEKDNQQRFAGKKKQMEATLEVERQKNISERNSQQDARDRQTAKNEQGHNRAVANAERQAKDHKQAKGREAMDARAEKGRESTKERLERLSQGKPTRSMEERRAHLERLNQPKERQPRDRSKDQDRDR